MTSFVFGTFSDFAKDFSLIVLSGLFVAATIYAALAYPQLRKRELRNTESYKGLGLFLGGVVLVASVFLSYYICTHRFTTLEAWDSEIVLDYPLNSRKTHIPCDNISYMELQSHPKHSWRQILIFTKDRQTYKSRKLHRSQFIPLYGEIEKVVCVTQ